MYNETTVICLLCVLVTVQAGSREESLPRVLSVASATPRVRKRHSMLASKFVAQRSEPPYFEYRVLNKPAFNNL